MENKKPDKWQVKYVRLWTIIKEIIDAILKQRDPIGADEK
jgi:hypothetical protein